LVGVEVGVGLANKFPPQAEVKYIITTRSIVFNDVRCIEKLLQEFYRISRPTVCVSGFRTCPFVSCISANPLYVEDPAQRGCVRRRV